MTILVYNAGFETKIQNTFWFVNSNHGSVLETCEVFRRISVQVLSLPSVSGDILYQNIMQYTVDRSEVVIFADSF